MTHRRVPILASVALFVLISTARAERILAVDRPPDAGIALDATTGRPASDGTIFIDRETGRLAAYRLTRAVGAVGVIGRAVATARLHVQRARPLSLPPAGPPPIHAVGAPETANAATASVGTPFGPPTGGIAFLTAGLLGVASWIVRRRIRPAYA